MQLNGFIYVLCMLLSINLLPTSIIPACFFFSLQIHHNLVDGTKLSTPCCIVEKLTEIESIVIWGICFCMI